jgi:hypothetical protein
VRHDEPFGTVSADSSSDYVPAEVTA